MMRPWDPLEVSKPRWPDIVLFTMGPPNEDVFGKCVEATKNGYDGWVIIPLWSRSRPRKLRR